jgi:hypothetical protein
LQVFSGRDEPFKSSVGNLNEVDGAFSKELGMPTTKDLMLARKIISDSGLDVLREYVKKTGGLDFLLFCPHWEFP